MTIYTGPVILFLCQLVCFCSYRRLFTLITCFDCIPSYQFCLPACLPWSISLILLCSVSLILILTLNPGNLISASGPFALWIPWSLALDLWLCFWACIVDLGLWILDVTVYIQANCLNGVWIWIFGLRTFIIIAPVFIESCVPWVVLVCVCATLACPLLCSSCLSHTDTQWAPPSCPLGQLCHFVHPHSCFNSPSSPPHSLSHSLRKISWDVIKLLTTT